MNQTFTAQRVPESMSAREIGVYMAHLRDQFHLSQQEVSERLHIRTRYVGAMEEGRFEVMPGKVYARGYLYKYAEFLGLDADQIVNQCLPDDVPILHRPSPFTASSLPHRGLTTKRRGYGVWVVVALMVAFAAQQMGSSVDDKDTAEVAVAPVPESMLHSVRTMLMPTSNNTQCLTTDTLLGCFYSDNVTRTLTRLDAHTMLPFAQGIDLSTMVLAMPAVAPQQTPTSPDAKETTGTGDE